MKTTVYKVMAICAIALAVTTTAQAQSKIEFGIEAGPNASRLYGNPDVNYNLRSKAGFTAGAFFQYNFTDMWSLHTGLLFDRKGAYTSSADDIFGNTIVNTYHINYDYVTLPIMVRANFLPVGGVRFFVNAGPYLGFLARQSTVHRQWDENDNTDKSTNVNTDNYKGFDFGLSGGVGVKIPVSSMIGIGVEVRDNIGFLNVSESNNDNARFKNNNVNFLASLIIAIP